MVRNVWESVFHSAAVPLGAPLPSIENVFIQDIILDLNIISLVLIIGIAIAILIVVIVIILATFLS